MNIEHLYGNHAVLKAIAEYVKHKRLSLNLTQQELAIRAGINRNTLAQLEKDGSCSLLTFVQVLRALDDLYKLNEFTFTPEVSPLLFMETVVNYRARASKPRKKT